LIFPNGKHRGHALHEVPTNYLQWATKQPFYRQELIDAIVEELDRRKENPSFLEPEEVWDPIKVGRSFFKRWSGVISFSEVRSVKRVKTPATSCGVELTHVVILRHGSLGDLDSRTQIWISEPEFEVLEKALMSWGCK
jgi:hypothetical protein